MNKNGARNPEAVEAALTWKAPKMDIQLMNFQGLANKYLELFTEYAERIYPMPQLMQKKEKMFGRNDEEQVEFRNFERERREAPVSVEEKMFVLDTDASVVAMSGILHQ